LGELPPGIIAEKWLTFACQENIAAKSDHQRGCWLKDQWGEHYQEQRPPQSPSRAAYLTLNDVTHSG
jgi:hypothetical protein